MLVRPNFVKFYLFFIFAYPENVMCLACVVKKFEFRRSRLRETPISIPLNCFKFYLCFIFTYLKKFYESNLKS